MSYIIDGVDGRDWQASSWVFHAMSDVLLEVLREHPETTEIADRLKEGLDMGIGYADVSDLLESPKRSALWAHAVDETLERLRQQGSSDWRDPSRFSEFLAEVEKLKAISTQEAFVPSG